MDGSEKFLIERFFGKDFAYWMMQVKDYLQSRKLAKPLNERRPEKISEEDWEEMDETVVGVV